MVGEEGEGESRNCIIKRDYCQVDWTLKHFAVTAVYQAIKHLNYCFNLLFHGCLFS